MNRAQLVAIFRLLAGLGIFLLMLAFLRACFSPPMLPVERLPQAEPIRSAILPERY